MKSLNSSWLLAQSQKFIDGVPPCPTTFGVATFAGFRFERELRHSVFGYSELVMVSSSRGILFCLVRRPQPYPRKARNAKQVNTTAISIRVKPLRLWKLLNVIIDVYSVFFLPRPRCRWCVGERRGRASGMSPQKARPSALEKKHAEDVSGGARRTSAFPFETGAGAPFGRFSAVGLLVQIEVDAGATPLARRDRRHHTPPARPRQAESSAGRRARPRHAPRRIQAFSPFPSGAVLRRPPAPCAARRRRRAPPPPSRRPSP